MNGRQLLILAGLLAGAPSARAEAIRVELELDPEVAGLEEKVILTLKVEGGGTQNPRFEPEFELDNLRIVGGPSQSTSIRILNGAATASRSLSWSLQPLEVGPARVYDVVVRVGSQAIEVPGRRIEVQEEVPEERRQRDSDAYARSVDPFDRLLQDPFDRFFQDARGRRRVRPRRAEMPKIYLVAEATPSHPYVGEQVLYTLYLFTQVDISRPIPEELPDFKGFWVREIPQPEELRPLMVERNGERLGRFVLLQRALFARRHGTFELGAVRARLMAKVPDQGPFGPLFQRSAEIVRESNAVSLEVRPLPEPPPGFGGAVGDLELKVDLAPRELAVGDAATLTVELSGRGHLQGLSEPSLPEMAGVEVFPPQQASDEKLRDAVLWGTRSWRYVVVPQRPGRIDFPPLAVPYFEPRSGTFRTATATPPQLAVRGTTRLASPNGETIELHPIRTAALPAPGSGGWSPARPWLFGLPWAAAAVLLWLRQRGGDGGSREARRRLVSALEEVSHESGARQAAAAIEDAWRRYLEERWQVPRGSASTQWSDILVDRGAPEPISRQLVELADDLHYLRYAPKLSSTADLRRDLLERSRRLARTLR